MLVDQERQYCEDSNSLYIYIFINEKKTPEGYSADNDKLVLKWLWKVKITRRARQFWKRTGLARTHCLIPVFKVTIMKIQCYRRADPQTEGIEWRTQKKTHEYDCLQRCKGNSMQND